MGSNDKTSGLQRMWGSWVDVAAMQEPDTIAIVMVTGALISLYNQIDALLDELKLRDVVAFKFQADLGSFAPLIADVLPAVNIGNKRLDRNFFRVVQLMCKVLEEARDALDDYFLASVLILHSSRTLNRRIQISRNKIKHAVSLYHNYCDPKKLRSGSGSISSSSSSSATRIARSSSAPHSRRGLSAADRKLDGPLKKLKEDLLQLESVSRAVTRADPSYKPCPKRILKLVAKMRSDSSSSSTIYPMESFSIEEFYHFCRVGGVEALVQLLNSPSQPVQAHAMVNLESLVANEQTRLKICATHGALEQLAAMVASTYGEVQHEALEILRSLLRNKGHVDCNRILFPGIVESLLELLEYPKVQANAAGVLKELSLNEGNHKKFTSSPRAVEKLVKLFSSQCPTLQFCAAATLCNIGVNETVRTQVINLPNVPSRLLVLLEIYEPWDLTVGSDRSNLNARLLTLSFRGRNEEDISPGAAGWFVGMLDSDLEPFQLRALEKLSKFTESLMKIAVQEGVLYRLVQLLHSSSVSVQEHAANTLWSFSVPQEFELKVAREDGAIRRLVELLDSESFGVRENACKVLESLTFNKQNRNRVAEEDGAIHKLSKLLFEDSLGVQANAASALWNLANTNGFNKAEVGRVGETLDRLVELLESKSRLVQEKAAGALMNLSCNPDNRTKIAAISAAIPRLVRLLQSRSTLVHQNAAGALYNLSSDEENAIVIAITPTAVRNLVTLLGSLSGIVQEYAAGAIANLCITEETRELCRQKGALPMLTELKSSPSIGARTQAKRALDLYGS
ncbi:unnamed protein product [Calypogeia fissa]